jgi:serine/threonine protein kinase
VFKPTIFGDLCLLERISVGGMAEVYRAKPFNTPNFESLLAVKRILPNLAEDEEFISMFIDEAKTAIRLNHPNICQNYKLGKLGESRYIVMAYIAGQDVLTILKTLIRYGEVMEVAQAVYIAERIASALDHAHHALDEEGVPMDIVHRDVSPQNVLISYAGAVKLIDFGIAKVAKQQHETQVGILKGKFSYMSPEQMTGQEVDSRTDLFALGTVLHEMLTGRRLFHGDSDFATMERVRKAEIPPPSTLNPEVSPELDKIVLKALARDVDERFQRGNDMEDALGNFLARSYPDYSESDLSEWMVRAFADDLAEERQRRALYSQFVTREDVHEYNQRWIDDIKRSMGASLTEEGEPNVPDSEVTALHDADYVKLVGELEEDVLEAGFEEEVLAESAWEPISNLLARKQRDVLASLDLPEPMELHRSGGLFEEELRTGRRILVGMAALVALAAVAIGLTLRGSALQGSSDVGMGMVMLISSPKNDLQIFVDGRLTATRTPATFRNIPAGSHVIEIRHPEYLTHIEGIEIIGDRASQLSIDLEPIPLGSAELTLLVDPAEATFYLDGAAVEGDGRARSLILSVPGEHLVELYHPGYFVAEERYQMSVGESRTVDVQLIPVQGTLIITSRPPGLVTLDGEPIGSTRETLTIGDLDTRVPHTIRIESAWPGYQIYETRVLFETAVEVSLFAQLRRFDEAASAPMDGVGYVAIETGEQWFRVLLEGHDTGQTTPVSAEAPFALRAGTRELILTRGAERHALVLDVQPGEVTAIDCGDPVWDCGL